MPPPPPQFVLPVFPQIDAQELDDFAQQIDWDREPAPKVERNRPVTGQLPDDIRIPPPKLTPGGHIEPTDPAPADPGERVA